MPKELKIIFFILFVLPVIAFVLVFFNSNSTPVSAQDIPGILTNTSTYDLGDVPLNGGLVTREYLLTNSTDKPLILHKITTSCMCTQAKVVIGSTETDYFGLEHPGDSNPPLNLTIASGQEFKLVFQFDPNAHGPQGVGPVDRSIRLIFSDPQGTKELNFKAIVTP